MITRFARRLAVFIYFFVSVSAVAEESLDRTGSQWSPALEWSLPNTSYGGNPYDLTATVVFRHDVARAAIEGRGKRLDLREVIQ